MKTVNQFLITIRRASVYVSTSVLLVSAGPAFSQEVKKIEATESSCHNTSYYDVPDFHQRFCRKRPRNLILMIGDGMGTAQIQAGMTANRGNLYLGSFRHAGFSRTSSANRYVTDSGAGGTAIATGHKANNSSIGIDSTKKPVPSILATAAANGLATGIVVTTSILDATPAAFVAHVPDRSMMSEIAVEFAERGPDVFIGGGRDHFSRRKDGRNLVTELTQKGYQVCDTITEIVKIRSGKLAGLLTENRVDKRGDQLAVTTKVAIDILANNKKGFFLMVEGSLIDGGGHENDMAYTVEEMLDFDRAVGKALEFASRDRRTLVVVTADHETGGLTIVSGNTGQGRVTGRFSTWGHTGVMVPVFAYGPGAKEFGGIDENTSFFNKFIRLLKLKKQ